MQRCLKILCHFYWSLNLQKVTNSSFKIMLLQLHSATGWSVVPGGISLYRVQQVVMHFMLTYFIAQFLNKLENERWAANMCGKCSGVVGSFSFHLPQFLKSTLIVFLLSNTYCSFNWCLSILFSLSSAPDNVAVTVCCLISMNCFTMIDSLTGPVIGCLVCSVTK